MWNKLAKLWFCYPKAFLFHTQKGKKAIFLQRGLKKHLYCLVLSSQAFFEKAIQNKRSTKNFDVTERSPTGRLEDKSQFIFPPELCTFKLNREQKLFSGLVHGWHLLLDTKLALNITFTKLYVATRTQLACVDASLGVQMVSQIAKIPNFSSEDLSWKHLDDQVVSSACLPKLISLGAYDFLKYCGWYADFNVYISGHQRAVFLTLCYQDYTTFEVNATYQTADMTGVVTISRLPKHLTMPQLISVTSIFSSELVYLFYFSASKFFVNTIEIKTRIKAIIFDGPSYFSKTLNVEKGKKITTSTFQCLVQILASKNSTILNYLQAGDVRKKVSLVEISKNETSMPLTVPGQQCNKSWCFLLFQATQNHTLNISILNMTYSGPYSYICTYAGVSSFEKTSSAYSEQDNYCQMDSSTQNGFAKSFYSRQEKLMLLFYWYPELGKQTVTVKAENTKCIGVHIDLCSLTAFCSKHTETCTRYVSWITQFSMFFIQETFDREYREINAPSFSYKSRGNTCTVIHFSQHGMLHNLLLKKCNIKFVLGDHKMPRSLIHHTVRGKVTSTAPFCFQFFPTKRPNFFYKNSASRNTPLSVGAQIKVNPNTRDFFASAVVLTPVYEVNSGFSKIEFIGASHSWADLVVWMTAAAEEKEHFSQPVNYLLPGRQVTVDHSLQSKFHFMLLCLVDSKKRCEFKMSSTSLVNRKKFKDYIYAPHTRHGPWVPFSHHLVGILVHAAMDSNKNCFSVSFQGHFTSLKLSKLNFKNQQHNTTSSVLQWIYDRYRKHFMLQIQDITRCKTQNLFSHNTSYCLNIFTRSKENRIKLTIVVSKIVVKHRVTTTKSYSWVNASSLCQKVGAQLPVLYSREQLDELISMIKLSSQIPFIKAFFIGLQYHVTQRVGNHIVTSVIAKCWCGNYKTD